MANQFFERLGFWIEDFDKSLNQDEEVGIRLVSFGQAVTFHVQRLGYHDPSLIIFHGITTEGQKVTLVQHVSQISFLLIAMKRRHPEQPKKPFGFHMPAKQPGTDSSDTRGSETDFTEQTVPDPLHLSRRMSSSCCLPTRQHWQTTRKLSSP